MDYLDQREGKSQVSIPHRQSGSGLRIDTFMVSVGFNSSQVVWKPKFSGRDPIDEPMFQFLIGSLEASLREPTAITSSVSIPHRQSGSAAFNISFSSSVVFQFLIGSLEASVSKNLEGGKSSFNSSQVVWKHREEREKRIRRERFNSSQVVWKPNPFASTQGWSTSFNSSQVVWKPPSSVFTWLTDQGFNSSQVVWKPSLRRSAQARKSCFNSSQVVWKLQKAPGFLPERQFQFLIGSLEAGYFGKWRCGTEKFQFLIGSLEALQL